MIQYRHLYEYVVLGQFLRERSRSEDNGPDVVHSLVPINAGDCFRFCGKWWRAKRVGIDCDTVTYSNPNVYCMEVEAAN